LAADEEKAQEQGTAVFAHANLINGYDEDEELDFGDSSVHWPEQSSTRFNVRTCPK
jgi:hypothetical protein